MFANRLSCLGHELACASATHFILRLQKQGEGQALLRQEEDKLSRKPDLLKEIAQAKAKADGKGYTLPEEVGALYVCPERMPCCAFQVYFLYTHRLTIHVYDVVLMPKTMTEIIKQF
jgi:hypothetical protein